MGEALICGPKLRFAESDLPLLSAASIFAVCAMTMHSNAVDIDITGAHSAVVDAFNGRNRDAVRSQLADAFVFYRGNDHTTHVGVDADIDRWSSTIVNAEQWNVKLAVLYSINALAGENGRMLKVRCLFAGNGSTSGLIASNLVFAFFITSCGWLHLNFGRMEG